MALLNHGINFVAPAAWIAVLMPLLSRVVLRNKGVAQTFPRQVAINFVVCAATLALGLAVFGRDGKMLTYLAVVALSATTQWTLIKGWRG